MHQAMFEKFEHVSPSVKPAVLRNVYRDLTWDRSASQETVIDERVHEINQHRAWRSKYNGRSEWGKKQWLQN